MSEPLGLQSAYASWLKPTISISVNVLAAFIQSVAIGMCAIVFPVALEGKGIGTSMIGMILAMDSVAAFLGALCVSFILRALGMKSALLISGAVSAMAILVLSGASGLISWSLGVFVTGFGSFMFIMLLQTWVNSIEFKKSKGLVLALYSTVLSIGLAVGPVMVNHLDALYALAQPYFEKLVTISGISEMVDVKTRIAFYAAFLASGFSLVPVLMGVMFVPKLQVRSEAHLWGVVMRAKGPMFAQAMGAVSFFGVTSFITIYGVKNGLSVSNSALLLTFFMAGSILLEAPLSWVSDYFDRRYVIVFSAFASLVCAVYLPMAIYFTYAARTLLFFWGGFTGCIYSTSMALISDRFKEEELVAANSGYSLMESFGGAVGVLLIGFFMDLSGTDGLPYVIMFASILYFSFALTRYEVR